MQNLSKVSLRAVRAFAAVANRSSISLAADDLGITPGAISHQIKILEEQVGASLLHRANNRVALTEAGKTFARDAGSGIEAIDRAVAVLLRQSNELTVKVAVSLAIRWLIPALSDFKEKAPDAVIRVETIDGGEDFDQSWADFTIGYLPIGTEGDGVDTLLVDHSRPVASPNLVRAVGYSGAGDIKKMPALGCARDDWDWRLWGSIVGVPVGGLQFAGRFDIDDTAIRAAVGGLGMVLATPISTRNEIVEGLLVPVPGFAPVELGRYVLRSGPRTDRLARTFKNWLTERIAADAAGQ